MPEYVRLYFLCKRTTINNMANNPQMNLQRFLAERATDEERQLVIDHWIPFLRNALVVGAKAMHVWPMNVPYSLSATLWRLLFPRPPTSELNIFSDYEPRIENMTQKQFLDYYDEESRFLYHYIYRSVPLLDTEKFSRWQNDQSAFPPDSTIYQDYRALEAAIGVIDSVMSNVEQAYRKLVLQIVQLENDVRVQNETFYLTEEFQRKFSLYK